MTHAIYKSVLPLRLFSIALCLASIMALAGCSTDRSNAKKAVEEHLKNQGITNLEMDLFYTSPEFPEKAYAGVTVTYNFATSEGKAQREFNGYILKREGRDWKVEQHTRFTRDESQAHIYMAGKKE